MNDVNVLPSLPRFSGLYGSLTGPYASYGPRKLGCDRDEDKYEPLDFFIHLNMMMLYSNTDMNVKNQEMKRPTEVCFEQNEFHINV